MLPPNIESAVVAVAARVPNDIRWAVSCGTALALHGVPYRPTDLDVFAGQEDASRIAASLRDFGVVFPYAFRHLQQVSSYWGRFIANSIEIDVVGDFCIERGPRVCTWNANHPCWNRVSYIRVGEATVPVFSLQDLLELYLMLPDEDAKVELIETSLQDGLRHRL